MALQECEGGTVRLAKLVLSLALVLSTLSACGDAEGMPEHRAVVYTAFYPLQWSVERVVGDNVAVRVLTPEGAEPHDFELDAKTLRRLDDAKALIYLGGDFQPGVASAAHRLPAGVQQVDVLTTPGLEPLRHGGEGADHDGAIDPHVWLDPQRMQAIVRSISATLLAVAPESADVVRANTDRTLQELGTLDRELRDRLAPCAGGVIVTAHASFGYFADHFGLQQLAVTGLSPDREPTAKELTEVTRLVRDRRVSTIFTEGALSPKLARTVADETGVRTDVLATLESRPDDDGDYLSAQRDNGARIARALGCA